MVYFIGAGSGAPDLITVRGMKVIEEADVILYAGSLVNPEVLNYAKKNPPVYNTAKMHLEEVIAVMKENEGIIARVHTGDPSLFGAIKEQMRELDALEIPYEVIPGVSSFSAAAATLNAEFTLPDVSQSLIITRIEGRTPVPEKEELSLMASHGCSMAIFLSVGHIERVQEALLQGAYSEETPVAVVYKASWPDEKVYRMKLRDLAKVVKEENLTKTSMILVGDFLGDTFSLSKLYDKSFTTEYREGIQ